MHRGLPGKPRYSKSTHKSIKNIAPQIRRRVIVPDEPDGEPSDSDDYDSSDTDEDEETQWRWSLPKDVMEDVSKNIGGRLEQSLQQDLARASLLDYLPFMSVLLPTPLSQLTCSLDFKHLKFKFI